MANRKVSMPSVWTQSKP